MAVHEAAVGLSAAFDVVELGVPASAALDASFDVTAATIQNLQLAATLAARFGLVAQVADQNLTVSPALLEGELSESEGKTTETLAYRVTGVTSATLEGRKHVARAAAGVPQDKEPHPHDPSIIVIGRRARFESDQDASRVLVDVTYGQPLGQDLADSGGASGTGFFSISPTTFREKIFLDKDGLGMQVSYQLLGSLFRRTVTPDVQRATWTATLTKLFDAPQYADIERASQVNLAYFRPFQARTLLFTGPTVNETDDGKYSHGYQFTYNPGTWIQRSTIWINGFVPVDASLVFPPGGLAEFFIYQEFDFSDLPVAFP